MGRTGTISPIETCYLQKHDMMISLVTILVLPYHTIESVTVYCIVPTNFS